MSETGFLEIVIAVGLVIGAVFILVGSIGLLKLDTAMKRLHAPTKAATLGIGALLAASMLHSFTFGEGSLKELLIMAFVFVTAPISANFIAKVAIHRGQHMPLPEPPTDATWSTLNPDVQVSVQPGATVKPDAAR